MNETVKIQNQEIIVKECNNQRVITFRDVDLVHERPDGTAGRNFRENRERFIEGEDYFKISADEIRRNKIMNISDKNHQDIVLLTESGYLMLVKSFTDDLAWKVQRQLVKSYFATRQIVSGELSPQLQLLINMEMKQKEHDQKLEELDNKVDSIKEVVALRPNAWRKESSNIINKIAQKLGGYEHIKLIREESYRILEERMHVALNIRLANKKKTNALNGMCKSKLDKLNQLDVIIDDPKLIEGYITIIKEMAIKYGVVGNEVA